MAVDPIAKDLQTAADCLKRLERDHVAVRARMAAGVIPTQTASLSIQSSGDPDGSVSWTSVESAGNLRIHTQASRYQDLIRYALVNLLEADLLRGLTVTANTTPETARIRCDGGAGEWADPTCERNSVSDKIWIEGHQHQLCQRCWDRYRQRQHRAGVA